jgi:hypothetical protein
VQYRDTDDQVKLLGIINNKKPKIVIPLELNQKFDSLNMLVAKDKAFIMAVDE